MSLFPVLTDCIIIWTANHCNQLESGHSGSLEEIYLISTHYKCVCVCVCPCPSPFSSVWWRVSNNPYQYPIYFRFSIFKNNTWARSLRDPSSPSPVCCPRHCERCLSVLLVKVPVLLRLTCLPLLSLCVCRLPYLEVTSRRYSCDGNVQHTQLGAAGRLAVQSWFLTKALEQHTHQSDSR